MARRRYDELPLIPAVIADTVCNTPYTGQELSAAVRNPRDIAEVEALRREMLAGHLPDRNIGQFSSMANQRCQLAYYAGSKWFTKCIRSKTNAGRDQLYVWITHWLVSYLRDPVRFKTTWPDHPDKELI